MRVHYKEKSDSANFTFLEGYNLALKMLNGLMGNGQSLAMLFLLATLDLGHSLCNYVAKLGGIKEFNVVVLHPFNH